MSATVYNNSVSRQTYIVHCNSEISIRLSTFVYDLCYKFESSMNNYPFLMNFVIYLCNLRLCQSQDIFTGLVEVNGWDRWPHGGGAASIRNKCAGGPSVGRLWTLMSQ